MENSWVQMISIIAIITGPIIAVIITLLYQSYSQKREVKMDTLLTLVEFRNSIPLNQEFVNALNTIDIVFHKHPSVIQIWHEYYAILHQPGESVDFQAREHKRIDLITEIAYVLGYKNIKQTDIDKFYIPIGHYEQTLMNGQIQKEFLNVLQGKKVIKVQLSDPKTQEKN